MLGIFNAVFRNATRTEQRQNHHHPKLERFRNDTKRNALEEELRRALSRPML